MTEIRPAVDDSDYRAFGELCREYVAWCRERCSEISWLADEVFAAQSLEDELKVLPMRYGPPHGKTLLAIRDGEVVGGGAYRRSSPETFEMKRLYVSGKAKGEGIGRRLCEALLESAKDEGAQVMRLDTVNFMTEAIAMYERFGFVPCAPYNTYPERLESFMVFLEKTL
ncbi:MAG TPA: GNAT family N-acetyltransferase [Acidobacteriaceae bacterium]|jgi:GNAT superfamily N-acetyltransferase